MAIKKLLIGINNKYKDNVGYFLFWGINVAIFVLAKILLSGYS